MTSTAMSMGYPARYLGTGRGPGMFLYEFGKGENKALVIESATTPPTHIILTIDGATLLGQFLNIWSSENNPGGFALAAEEPEEPAK
jgi:hypothetical protein